MANNCAVWGIPYWKKHVINGTINTMINSTINSMINSTINSMIKVMWNADIIFQNTNRIVQKKPEYSINIYIVLT